MNIKRVKYKMSIHDDWKVGYMIGSYDGENKTLIDENLNYVPKIIENNKEYTVYDCMVDYDNHLNLTIPI